MTLAGPIQPERIAAVRETPALLEVRDLRIEAHGPEGPRTIVSSLDLSVRRGETLAIVGESGSGKSMTARAITGLLPAGVHAGGSIRFEGHSLLELKERDRATFRGRHIGLVFQDPFTMLNPIIPIGEQLLEPVRDARGRRLRGEAARHEAARRLAEVGIRDASVADRYPFQLSGGMRQRVGLAASLAADPELLIADEPATALDVTTQTEVLALLQSVREQRGMALILITHDLRIAFSACERVAVLYAGRLLETGPTVDVEHQPMHPYSLGLLMSEPDSDRRLVHLESIPGAVPRPDDVAAECAFAPRCSFAQPECRAGRPPLELVAPGHRSACVRVHEIAPAMVRLRHESLAAADVPPDAGTYAPLLKVDQVHKRFSTGRGRENVAIHEASLAVGQGEAVGLVGESGSGKTTLSRCVVGLEVPTSGTISWADDPAPASQNRSVRRHAQMVFQDPYSSLNPRLSIESALAEALRLAESPPKDISAGVDDLLAQVGLSSDYRKRRPARLSGGQRQRVAIARALALQPDMLICDEPVSALDVSVQAQILQLLRDVRERLGIGYLVITHDLAVVRQVVDRVYVMQAGRIVEEGPVAQVLDSPQHPYTQRLVDSIPRSTASPRKESTS